MSEYSEVEKPLLKQLEDLGWQVIDQGEKIPEDPIGSLRDSFRQAYLPEVLSRKIKEINSWMSAGQIAQWVDKAIAINERSLIDRNEKAYEWLIEPPMDLDEQTRESKPVRLIDFKDVNKNSFIAISVIKGAHFNAAK